MISVDAGCISCCHLSPLGADPCSPERSTTVFLSGGSRRRVTRKYEAARRNGHYTLSPEAVDDSSSRVLLPGKIFFYKGLYANKC